MRLVSLHMELAFYLMGHIQAIILIRQGPKRDVRQRFGTELCRFVAARNAVVRQRTWQSFPVRKSDADEG